MARGYAAPPGRPPGYGPPVPAPDRSPDAAGGSAAARWTAALQAWRLPDALLSAAPRDPYALPVDLLRDAVVPPDATPTGQAVRSALRPGDRLLDVGVGAGRIAAAFADEHDVVGVEPRPALAEESRRRGIAVVGGRWPDVAPQVGTAAVVLSTHVLYDVQAPAPFLRALHWAATRRVVLEVTAVHPWVPLGPLYRAVHDLDRPDGPSAELLAEVVVEVCGVEPEVARWTRPGRRYASRAAYLDHQRQVLCVDAAHPRAAVLEALADEAVDVDRDGVVHLPPVDQVTLWWDHGTAS
jgi:SAM-dependent methyltransferase